MQCKCEKEYSSADMIKNSIPIQFWKIFLSGFGTGFLPLAPGTWGAILALLLMWPFLVFLPHQFTLILSIVILIFSWIGALGSDLLATDWGKDPRQTVIDEMVGIWIALLGIPRELKYWVAAFLLFRFFDILKPVGIRRLEKTGGGWAVMLDDILAGVYANVVIQMFLFLAHFT